VWNFLYTIQCSDVVQGIDAGGETSVQAEDLVVDQGGKGEVVEEIGEVFPYVRVAIFSETFIVEPIDLCDLAGFVVATEDGDALGISDFQGYEEGDGLNGVVTSINIIALSNVSIRLARIWLEVRTHE
jgi:hypothetical protein